MLRRARDRNILIQFKKPDGMPTNTCEANKFRTLRACLIKMNYIKKSGILIPLPSYVTFLSLLK